MNKRRKSIAIALACAMLVGTIATTVAIPGSDVPFGITVSAAEIADSGSCGENLTYTIDNEGTLTISGTGEMDNYEWNGSPFYENSDIKNVVIEEGVTSIGVNAFYKCSSLTSITIPDGVASIGDYAFSKCASLEDVTIPDSVTSIGQFTFRDCTSLSGITIPDSVTSIGYQALGYYYDYNLGKFVKQPDFTITGYTGSEAERYANENEFEFIALGDTDIIDSGSCGENLTYTIDSDGTLTISGNGDMYNYNSEESPFYNNSDIKKIIIEDGVTSIGSRAFYGCEVLTDITIPDSVTGIGENVFIGCHELTSVIIPDSVTSIGDGVFQGCTSLTSITLPNTLTSLGNYMFCNCEALTSMIVPDSVTSIGECTFEHCTVLESITLPNSVTSIGDYAFNSCYSLTNITIPKSVVNIKEGALGYSYIGKISELTITGYPGTEAERYAKNNGFEFIALGDTDIIDSGSCGENVTYTLDSDGTLTISGTGDMNNYEFGESPFFENSDIKKIIIEDGVTSIGSCAFMCCSSLTSVDLPDGLKSIGYGAFDECSSLTSINIPDSMTSIGTDAFCDCSSLKSITIPDSVTSIGEHALGYFYNYDNYEYEKQTGFKIRSHSGTEAERYAKEMEIEFIPLTEPEYTPGDVTGDGSVDIADSLFVARADAGLATLTDAQKQAADVNGDGSADIADALFIARVDAGLASL